MYLDSNRKRLTQCSKCRGVVSVVCLATYVLFSYWHNLGFQNFGSDISGFSHVRNTQLSKVLHWQEIWKIRHLYIDHTHKFSTSTIFRKQINCHFSCDAKVWRLFTRHAMYQVRSTVPGLVPGKTKWLYAARISGHFWLVCEHCIKPMLLFLQLWPGATSHTGFSRTK